VKIITKKTNSNYFYSNSDVQLNNKKSQKKTVDYSNQNKNLVDKKYSISERIKNLENIKFPCFNQDDHILSKESHHYKIDLMNVMTGKDKRTTLMVRNIPNKYNMETFTQELIKSGFKNKYDLVYLPIDYSNGANLGFAFVNLVDSMHVLSFYEMFRGKKWKNYNSVKECELAYAKIQGKKHLINHFQKGSVLKETTAEKMPLILPTPKTLPLVEIPMKFLNAFSFVFPFASLEMSEDKFLVHSYYGINM